MPTVLVLFVVVVIPVFVAVGIAVLLRGAERKEKRRDAG
jgi:hypothetical protein